MVRMKPIRGLSETWEAMPRERKTALVSLVLLVSMLGALAGYQRFALVRSPAPTGRSNAPAAAAPAEAKPAAAPADLAGKMVRPLAGVHRVLKSFGSVDQSFGDTRLYGGVAYEARAGESVQAAAAGTVLEITPSDPLEGGVVTVDHGGGLITRYAGLGKILATLGGRVQAGTILGQVGTPGPAHQALGTHLEFQVLKNGQPEDPSLYTTAE